MSRAQLAREVVIDHDVSFHLSDADDEQTASAPLPIGHPEGFVLGITASAVQFTPLSLVDRDPLYADLDRDLGVLGVNGADAFFALNGKARLRQIKAELLTQSAVADDEFCTLIVPLA